jgi:hypothetical protein
VGGPGGSRLPVPIALRVRARRPVSAHEDSTAVTSRTWVDRWVAAPMALAVVLCLLLAAGAPRAEAPPRQRIALTDFPRLDATCATKEVEARLNDLLTKQMEVQVEIAKLHDEQSALSYQLALMVRNKATASAYTDIVHRIMEYDVILSKYLAYVEALEAQRIYYYGLKPCGDYNDDGSRRTAPPPVPKWPGPAVPPPIAPPPPKPLPPCGSPATTGPEIAAIEDRIQQLKTLEGEVGKTYAEDLTKLSNDPETRARVDRDLANLRDIFAELATLNERLAALKALPPCAPGSLTVPQPPAPAPPPEPHRTAPTPARPVPPSPPPPADETTPALPGCPPTPPAGEPQPPAPPKTSDPKSQAQPGGGANAEPETRQEIGAALPDEGLPANGVLASVMTDHVTCTRFSVAQPGKEDPDSHAAHNTGAPANRQP